MNANRKKNIAVIACVLFVFVTLASLFYIAKEENHQCTGEDCPICACIRQAKQIDKNGYVIVDGNKTKEFWDGYIRSTKKPLRLKIRNICGDETVWEV